MDKIKLKKRIQNFAINVGMAIAMFSLGLIYLPIVIQGEGFWPCLSATLYVFVAIYSLQLKIGRKSKSFQESLNKALFFDFS